MCLYSECPVRVSDTYKDIVASEERWEMKEMMVL